MRCIGLSTTYDRDKLVAADLVVDAFAQIDLEALDKSSASRTRLRT